ARTGRPSPSTSSARATMSASTQPPLTEPAISPRAVISIRAPGSRGAEPCTCTSVASAIDSPSRSQQSSLSKSSRMPSGPRGPPLVERRRRDQLLEVPVVPERELQLLRAPEEELDVVLGREADAAVHLLRHRGHVAVRLAGEELRHRRELRDRASGRE